MTARREAVPTNPVYVDPAMSPRGARLVDEVTCSLACVRPPDHPRVCFVPGHPTHVDFREERDATGQKRFDTNRVTIPAAPLRELLFPAALGLVRTTAGLSGGLMALASSLITVVSLSTRVSSIVLVASPVAPSCNIILTQGAGRPLSLSVGVLEVLGVVK
jgi:hypothetical protein